MLLDQLYPPVCAGCDAPLAASDTLCPACFAGLRHISAPLCPVLGLPFDSDPGPGGLSAEAIADLPNCVLDVSNWNEHLHDNPGDLIARLATWRSIVGSERILFASDQASGKRFTGERSELPAWVDFFRDLPQNVERWGYRFDASEAAAMLGGNALKFYNLN